MLCPGLKYVARYQRMPTYVYDNFQNYAQCDYTRPNGAMNFTQQPLPPAVAAKGRALIYRPPQGSVKMRSASSPLSSYTMTAADVSKLQGVKIGETTDGTPIFMGAPLTTPAPSTSTGGYLKFELTPEAKAALGGGSAVASMPNDAILVFPIIGAIIVFAVVIAIAAVTWILCSTYMAGTQANLDAIKEQDEMRKYGIDAAIESTAIQSEYDSPDGKYHTLTFKNGGIVTLDNTTGKGTVVQEGQDLTDLIKEFGTAGYTLPSSTIQGMLPWVAATAVIIVVGYVAYRVVSNKQDKGYYVSPRESKWVSGAKQSVKSGVAAVGKGVKSVGTKAKEAISG